MNTTTKPQPGTLAQVFLNLPESIRDNCPQRPGLPGAPKPNSQTIHAWIVASRTAILAAASNTCDLALTVARAGDVEAADDLRKEAAHYLDLASKLGDLMGLPRSAA